MDWWSVRSNMGTRLHGVLVLTPPPERNGMKTKYEWHGEWCASKYSSIADFVEAIQRDTWDSATEAQMNADGNSEGEPYTPAPFPPMSTHD